MLKEANMKVLVVILIKDNRLGFSKIDRDLQIDLRGSRYCTRKVAYFRHFQTKLGDCITGIYYIKCGNPPCFAKITSDNIGVAVLIFVMTWNVLICYGMFQTLT